MNSTGQHAIVMGGSMAGLLAARVLAESYERVTVVERDGFPAAGENRKGVPQGRHVHALLGRGREILEELLPGFSEELVARGGVRGDYCEKGRFFYGDGFHCAFPSGMEAINATRPLIEGLLRERVMARPNVRVIEPCDVLGFLTSGDGQRVAGVRVIRRAEGSAEEQMTADLVVDATGRGSRSPAWLKAMGYDAPDESVMEIGLSYTTRFYRFHSDDLDGARAMVIVPDRGDFRGAVALAVEGERWHVSLSGYFGDHAPTDDEGFLAFARSLPAPELYDLLRNAEPMSAPVTLRFPANQRRHYERLHRFPAGLLVFGDALCAFNPKYAQGMSVAAMQAMDLRSALKQGERELAKRFFAAASKTVDAPWQMVTGGDLKHPRVQGERPGMVKFINGYLGKLHRAAMQDPQVSLAFAKVVNLMEPPPSILKPQIALRVLWGNLPWKSRRKRDARSVTLVTSG